MKLITIRTTAQGVPTTAMVVHKSGLIVNASQLEELAGKSYLDIDDIVKIIRVDNKDHLGKNLDLVIEWNIALFDKVSFSGDFDIFEEINQYWSQLPQVEQTNIFKCYLNIKETFDSEWDTNELTKKLYVLIEQLFSFHDLEKVKHWCEFYSYIQIPQNIEVEFVEAADNSRTRDRTYDQKDYKGLVALSILLRPMIPIWGEFIQRTKKEIGTVFKEYYACRLLTKTLLINSSEMEKLRRYVVATIPSEKSKSSPILDGLSTEDYPTWMLSMVLVRRLSIGDVRGLDQNSNLATFIYKYIGQRSKGHDNSFIGLVKDKIVEGQSQEGENNLSKLEGYKIKQEISEGDIITIAYYAQDIMSLAFKLCPDIKIELLEQSFLSIKALETQQIYDPQILLTQWVTARVIPHKGLQHISKILLLGVMAVAQAALWHKGYFELAGLVSAAEETNNDALRVDFDSRARIKKEQLEILDALYPYSKRSSGKQKTAKRTNPAAESIDLVSNLFVERNWRLTIPDSWIAQLYGNKNNRRTVVSHDIKIKLADLAISLAQRSF